MSDLNAYYLAADVQDAVDHEVGKLPFESTRVAFHTPHRIPGHRHVRWFERGGYVDEQMVLRPEFEVPHDSISGHVVFSTVEDAAEGGRLLATHLITEIKKRARSLCGCPEMVLFGGTTIQEYQDDVTREHHVIARMEIGMWSTMARNYYRVCAA